MYVLFNMHKIAFNRMAIPVHGHAGWILTKLCIISQMQQFNTLFHCTCRNEN